VLTSTATATEERSPQAFEDAVAALEQADPDSPGALSARLDYAQYLVDAADVDCHQRLDAAQSQLDTVTRTPGADVELPNGRARTTDIQYRVKLARASCGAEPAERESDLREALAAAQQAVGLYRDALDYRSMAIMQFNVAVTQRMSGDNDAAVTSLESALAMDHEYGFRQDADDNNKLLALWSGPAKTVGGADPTTAAASAEPAVTAPDTPGRSVSLKFAWAARDATVGIQVDHAGFMNDSVFHGSAHRSFKQHVHARGNGWIVSYEAGQIAYDVPGDESGKVPRNVPPSRGWPSTQQYLAASLGRYLLLPGFDVSAKGDFEQFTDLKRVVYGEPAAAAEERAAEDYDFKTEVWIGATLEQGVWYEMSGPLILAGTRQFLFPYDVSFAYTHDVPCTPTSTSQSCIEIVVHATPDAKRVSEMLNYLNRRLTFHRRSRSNYWSATDMRIVTDPNTLETYVYDVRRYWHGTGGVLDSDKPENHSERLVWTFTYP
jgi:tetratricopeptide (TPR) repeat protein